MLKYWISGGVLAFATALGYSNAHAQSWSGVTVGANSTYAISGSIKASQDGSDQPAIEPAGPIIGAQLGYMYELPNNFTVGIEGDYQILWVDGSQRFLACPAALCQIDVFQTNTVDIDSVGTVRARLGLAQGRYHPYVTGGYAFGSAMVRATFDGAFPDVKQDVRAHGWIVGGGVEHRINNSWSLRLEYAHAELSDKPYEFTANIVRLGINWHL
jgi:opacity protein-like surface antigen